MQYGYFPRQWPNMLSFHTGAEHYSQTSEREQDHQYTHAEHFCQTSEREQDHQYTHADHFCQTSEQEQDHQCTNLKKAPLREGPN